MKKLMIVSGVLGCLLLFFRVIGTVAEFTHNNLLLIAGIILFAAVFIPLLIIDRIQQKRKIDSIIKSYKDSNKVKSRIPKGDKVTKGWGLNNSPFRDRKSGATWGGGNIKGAGVTRGNRKSFLK